MAKQGEASRRARPSVAVTWALVPLAGAAVTATFWMAGYGPVDAPEQVGIVAGLALSMLLLGWITERTWRRADGKLFDLLESMRVARENTGTWAMDGATMTVRWDGEVFWCQGRIIMGRPFLSLEEERWCHPELLGQAVALCEAQGMEPVADTATRVMRARLDVDGWLEWARLEVASADA